MSLLDRIQTPADMRKLPVARLGDLAEEIRARILQVVGKRGGHLTSNLGVTELTIALHRVFDFAQDRLLWDVGHQCYPHKLLTGRNARFETLRGDGGISGFPSHQESPFDLFDVGHAGTAIATAVGLARGDQILGRDVHTVALVGDASIVNGVAFEGLNQAGTLDRQLLVVLNDNSWGIAPTQGAFSHSLAKLRGSTAYSGIKQRVRDMLNRLPVLGKPVFDTLDHLKEGIKATLAPHQIFEQLGFQYVGPVDGHDLIHLIEMLEILKDVPHPVLLHVHTDKGRGCEWASKEPGRFHSPKPFEVKDGKVTLQAGGGKSWTRAFADTLINRAEKDDRVFALTAAMPDGTGLNVFAERFPDRYRDCGIAESCTVDMAAGMAKAGLRPVVAIYSTFLQRAFDQVFQEVVLQGLPVVFCLDRAGLVGGDGPVHHGFLDIAFLRVFPRMVLMAPMDEQELDQSLEFALSIDQPTAIRYPRDNVPVQTPRGDVFQLGLSRTLREGDDATILAYGACAVAAMEAADLLAVEGIEVSVVNARFAKPVDSEMVRRAVETGRPVVTVEDHSITGGFGTAVLEQANELGLVLRSFQRLGIPADRFIAHGSRPGQLAEVGIDATGIAATLQKMMAEEAESDDGDLRDFRQRALLPG